MSLAVEHCHQLLRARIQPGERLIDATAGRGRDTLLLARLAGPAGEVLSLDLQAEALAATAALLDRSGPGLAPVRLLQGDHAQLLGHAGEDWLGRVAACVFNLGYLPGADQALITRPPTTLPALRAAADLLRPGGLLAVVVYPGHPGGAGEAEAVEGFFRALDWPSAVEDPETARTAPAYPHRPRLIAGLKPAR